MYFFLSEGYACSLICVASIWMKNCYMLARGVRFVLFLNEHVKIAVFLCYLSKKKKKKRLLCSYVIAPVFSESI